VSRALLAQGAVVRDSQPNTHHHEGGTSMSKFVYEAAKYPDMMQRSKKELLALGTSKANQEIARRQRNKQAKREALRG
jgi:hypothetical protein